jgi:hypothetical protein
MAPFCRTIVSLVYGMTPFCPASIAALQKMPAIGRGLSNSLTGSVYLIGRCKPGHARFGARDAQDWAKIPGGGDRQVRSLQAKLRSLFLPGLVIALGMTPCAVAAQPAAQDQAAQKLLKDVRLQWQGTQLVLYATFNKAGHDLRSS